MKLQKWPKSPMLYYFKICFWGAGGLSVGGLRILSQSQSGIRSNRSTTDMLRAIITRKVPGRKQTAIYCVFRPDKHNVYRLSGTVRKHAPPKLEGRVRFPVGLYRRLEKPCLRPAQPRARRWWVVAGKRFTCGFNRRQSSVSNESSRRPAKPSWYGSRRSLAALPKGVQKASITKLTWQQRVVLEPIELRLVCFEICFRCMVLETFCCAVFH